MHQSSIRSRAEPACRALLESSPSKSDWRETRLPTAMSALAYARSLPDRGQGAWVVRSPRDNLATKVYETLRSVGPNPSTRCRRAQRLTLSLTRSPRGAQPSKDSSRARRWQLCSSRRVRPSSAKVRGLTRVTHLVRTSSVVWSAVYDGTSQCQHRNRIVCQALVEMSPYVSRIAGYRRSIMRGFSQCAHATCRCVSVTTSLRRR